MYTRRFSRMLLVSLLALLVSMSTLATASPAMAADTYQVRGRGAYAYFYTSTDCGYSYVSISANEFSSRGSGAPAPTMVAYMYVDQYDYCTNTGFYGFGSQEITTSDFQIQDSLASASLNTTIPVCDYLSGNCPTFSVNLVWTATGSSSRVTQNAQYKSPHCIQNLRFKSTQRSASASGSVSDGTTNWISGQTSTSASMDSGMNGTVTVGCQG